MKKIIISAIIGLALCSNVYASGVSDWAKTDYNLMSSYGYLNAELLNGELSDNITRLEFCKIIMNIYENYRGIVTLSNTQKNVFIDTNDTDVLKAYSVGIVNGVSDNQFNPSGYITREEMSVMISRLLNTISHDFNKFKNQILSYKTRFSDSNLTSEWAMEDIAAICYYEIITGTTENTVEPLGFATKEQAICMLNRVVNNFAPANEIYPIPEVKFIKYKSDSSDYVNISWSKIIDAISYDIIIKQCNADDIKINVPSSQQKLLDYNLSSENGSIYTIYVCVNLNNGNQILSLPYILDINNNTGYIENEKDDEDAQDNTQGSTDEDIQDTNNSSDDEFEDIKNDVLTDTQIPILTLTEKEQRVFPDGIYFETEEIAEQHMTEVTVPVWVLKADGTKYSSTKTLEVNQALADDVVSIFTEIYNDPSQFPIKDVGGYSWRNTAYGKVSQHSYGTCIDINYKENYYVTPDGTAVVGTHWKPYEDPYSIPEDSIVVRTFAKYGWAWGGNAWGPSYNKDYMHFTYLGK